MNLAEMAFETGDSQLLGEFCRRVVGLGYADCKLMPALSQNGLQTGAEEAVLDYAGICDRIQYHGIGSFNRIDFIIFATSRTGRYGLGVVHSKHLHFAGWARNGRISPRLNSNNAAIFDLHRAV